MNSRLADAIIKEAERIGADPHDFATVISYETGGTFDPWQRGPTTKWGVHRGLIQMGEPQRGEFGYYKGMPIADAVRSSADYLQKRGFKPGGSLVDMYSTINAGAPGLEHRSDEAAGGAWGTVADKVNHQMEGHKKKATGLLGGTYLPSKNSYFQDSPSEFREAEDIDPGVYTNMTAPSSPTFVEMEQNKTQPYEHFLRDTSEAIQSYSITGAATRWASSGMYDPDFAVDWDRFNKDLAPLPENYHDYISNYNSERDYEERIRWATEDVERQGRLQAAGGFRRVGSSLLAGALDPIPLAAGVLTGGAATAAIGAGGGLAGRIAIGAGAGAGFNAAVEYGSQQVFDDPHADPVMGAVFGAAFGAFGGALMRNPATQYEANMALTAAARAAAETAGGAARRRPDGVVIGGSDDSVGAMRNQDVMDNLIGDEAAMVSSVRDESVDRGAFGPVRLDTTAQMTTSNNPLTRLFGFHLFTDPVGTIKHAVTPDSVNARQTALHRVTVGNFNTVYQPLKSAYIKARGAGALSLTARAKLGKEFAAAVTAYTRSPHKFPNADPNVVAAAKANIDGYAAYSKEMREAGLMDQPIDNTYTPLISDQVKIAEIDQQVHHETMGKFFEQAVLSKAPTIDPKIAKKIGTGYWNAIRRASYGIEDGMTRSVHLGDREGFKQAFAEVLENRGILTEDQLDEAFNVLTGMIDDLKQRPASPAQSAGNPRLKRRTLMDYDFEADVAFKDGSVRKMSVYDLFEDDAEFLYRRYARNMSGRVAFAKTKIRNPSRGDELMIDGIRSEGDVDRMISMLAESYRQMGGDHAANTKAFKKDAENIRYAWRAINGMPVWDNANNFNQWSRRIKSAQFSRLMSNMGLNQIQEAWKLMSLVGYRAAMQQLPSIRRTAREVREGKWDANQLQTELSHMTGIGLDGLYNRYDLRMEDARVGAGVGSRFEQGVDRLLDGAQQITTQVSLMRNIMDFQQRWAMNSITQQMTDMGRRIRRADGSFDFNKLKKVERDRLATMGIGEEDAALLWRNLMDHGEFDGGKITGMNPNNWDAEAVSKFRHFVGRYTDHLVQMNDFGALAKWMSHPVASMFIQFRSFVFGAWGKSALWSMNHGGKQLDPRILTLVMGELAAGVATFAIRNTHLLATEDGQEKFMEEVMDPKTLLTSGWARTATASVIPMFIDSMLVLGNQAGFDVEPQFGQARSSGSAMDAAFGSPAVGHGQDFMRFLKGANQAARGEGWTQSAIRSGARTLPLGNFTPFVAGLSALIEDLPEK